MFDETEITNANNKGTFPLNSFNNIHIAFPFL